MNKYVLLVLINSPLIILAILMAVGLVGFGIGGATSGGIFDVSGGCGGNDTNNTFQEDVDKAQERTQKFPSNAGAWAALTRAQYQLAATHADQQTGAFTDEGRKVLDRGHQPRIADGGGDRVAEAPRKRRLVGCPLVGFGVIEH